MLLTFKWISNPHVYLIINMISTRTHGQEPHLLDSVSGIVGEYAYLQILTTYPLI